MWPILLKGILLGCSLSFLIGPLFFTLVQTSFERGLRAGFAVAIGIWASDLMFVLMVLFFVKSLETLAQMTGFNQIAGIFGGVLLIIFGASNFFTKKSLEKIHQTTHARNQIGYFIRGFLINSINPFTVFFWLGITSTVIVPNGWSGLEAFIFFGGMLGMLIFTDSLKVISAQKISRWLTPNHIQQIRFGLGGVLIIFGISLIIRTL